MSNNSINILFWELCSNGKAEEVRNLLKNHRNVDVNWTEGSVRWTPLYGACKKNRLEVVELLLSLANIDVNKGYVFRFEKTNRNHTPLHIACFKNYLGVIQLLLSHPNIDVNRKDRDNNTPLKIAEELNHPEAAKLVKNWQQQSKISFLKNNKLLEDLKCPITSKIMIDPVVTADGHTYEREAISIWLEQHDSSPLTGAKLEHKNLTTNWTLKKMIDKLRQPTKKIND